MATPEEDPVFTEEDVVLTEEGALPRAVFEARQAAETASEEIDPVELLERRRKEIVEETADAPITTALERGIGAATFGLTDVLASEESREEMARRVEASPTAALVGEIGGAVVPGLLSGGTGTLGTIARLSPAGRFTAATSRLASRGGLSRSIIGAGLEGAAGAAGDYVSRVSLDGDAEFSAEALLSAGLKGGALGGVLGGVGDVVARGAGKLGKTLGKESPIGKLADEAIPAKAPSHSLIGAKKAPKKWTSYKNVVKKELTDDSADALRAMGQRIDDVATRSGTDIVEELASDPRLREAAIEGTGDLVGEARDIAAKLDVSAKESKAWFDEYAGAVDLGNAKRRVTKSAPTELEDRGAALIAETDELSTRLERITDELRGRAGIEIPAKAVDPSLARMGKELAEDGKKRGFIGRAGEVGSSALGVSELAGAAGIDTGIPSAKSLLGDGVLGDLAGLYFKYKGIKAASKGLGILPGTRATQAAEKVNSLGSRIKAKTSALASGALKGISRSTKTRLLPAQVASRIKDLQSITPAQAAADTHADLEHTTGAVQEAGAARAAAVVSYLQETAPKDPIPERPSYMPAWQPSTLESMVYERRLRATADPEYAIDAILTSPSSAIELETMERLYPAQLAFLREDIMNSADGLQSEIPPAQFAAIARTLHLPLTIETMVPGYGTMAAQIPTTAPDQQFTRPSTPGASPSVNLEDTSRRPR